MANLKDLIVSGPARFLNKIYGNLEGTAVLSEINPISNNNINMGSSSMKWNTIYATTFNGNATTASQATKATQDSNGNAITGYIRNLSVSGTTITYTKGDGSTGTITTQDNNTDTKVTQTATSSNLNYPLLLAPNGQSSTTTTTAYFDSGVTLNPSTNTITANISGNASTANNATKATQDSDGKAINTTYLKLAGGTMTGVLEANGGIKLNSATQSGTLQYILGIKPFADGGNVIWQSASDVTVGNANKAGQVNNNLIIKWGSGSTEGNNLFTYNGSSAKTITITPSAIGASESGHTHYYAGSSSVGGAANSALTVGQGNDPNTEFDANTIAVPTSKKTFYSTNSNRMANRPSGTIWGYLDVGAFNSSYMMQTFINGDNANIYARVKYNNTWKDWKQVAFVDTKVNTATAAEKLVNSSGTALTKGSSTQPIYFSNGVPVAITGTINNNAASATILQTARTFNVSGGATGTAQTFNGAGNVSIPITAVKESYLTWGDKNISGNITPIGASLSAEHSANRLAFINGNALTFEYSSDGGTTWTDYGYSASNKSSFCTTYLDVPIGRASSSTEYTTNSKTRITISAQSYVYTDPRKLLIRVSSSGGMNVVIEYKNGVTDSAWQIFGTYALSGWSGWNDIPLVLSTLGGGSGQTGNTWFLRLTFNMTSVHASYKTNASVLSIRLFGINDWHSASSTNNKGPMSSTGHLYSYDIEANATFPAKVTASNGGFKGNLDGTAEYAKLLTTARTIQTKLDSTTSASFNGGSNITPGVTGTLGIGNGGTGTSTAPTQGGVIYASSTTAYASTTAGTSGQLLQSAGTGKPTWITATNSNTASTVVKRDGSGNFSAGTITATLSGNASTATKLKNYYGSRPTTLSPGVSGDGSVISFKNTSSITDSPRPGDGHVLHFNWDNAGGFDSQLLLMTGSSTLQYRGMSNGTWTSWVTSLDSGNYTNYTVTKTGEGASGTWGINITGNAASASSIAWGNITGKPSTFTPSDHNHDDRYYTESEINSKLVPKTEGSTNGAYTLYRALGNNYRGGSSVSYHRIALPQSTSWGMFLFKILIRENYSSGNAGEILIYANHSSAAEWNTFYAICVGNLSTNIKVYGSDKKYIYIAGNFAYSGLSVEELLVGDSATSINLSNVTIDVVSALPSTYQTATMYYGLHSGNYNSYAPSKTGTGASGTWGINITGSSTSCTGNAASANKVNKSLIIQFNGSSLDTHKFIYDGSVEKTVNITPEGIGASAKAHTHSGVYAPLSNGIIPANYLPSYVDDVLEYNGISKFPSTGESGKIYVDTSTNLTYRWSGSAYTEISKSLALGETSTTAYYGDKGKAAYTHAVTNKGNQFSQGFYKIATNVEGHVTAAVGVTKDDITKLGIPAQDTTYGVAKYNVLGLVKPAYTSTGAATLTTAAASNTNTPTIAVRTTDSERYYGIEADKNGYLYVNVPWISYNFSNNNPTLSWGASSTIGRVGGVDLTLKMPANPNTHYITKIYAGATGATSNATSDTINPYLTVCDDSNYRNQVQFKGSGATSVLAINGAITISSTNSAHAHTAGTGLIISNSGGISGTTTYSVNLNSTTSLGTIGTTSKLYAVGVDQSGKLCVKVPWTDTDIDTGATDITVTGTGNAITAASYDASTRKITLTKGATYNNYSLPVATASTLGGVKIGSNISVSSGTISLSKTNVTDALGYTPPTSDTKYNAGTGLSLSSGTFSVNTGYTTSGKNYKVSVDNTSGGLYVNVPWTDTNTNTWKANTSTSEGYVASGNGQANKVWATDANGNPAWRTGYTLPTASSSTKGGVKTGAAITDTTGYTAVHIKDGVIYYKDTNTNTHYTTRLYAGASGTAANASATNPYLKITDDNTYRNQIQFKGGGATTVSSDANGVITISSTDTNDVYTHPTTSGNKHIPSGGSSGQILRWSADGTAAWGSDNNTWKANTSTSEGYVASGSGQANKVWATDASGNPAWRTISTGSTYSAGNGLSLSETTFSVSYGTSAAALGTSSAGGSANTVSRSDHVHAFPALTSCTGTLTVAKGGTGLTASPSMLVNLGSSTAANVLQASPRPGITGTLAVGNGGTGATSKSGARTNLGITSGHSLNNAPSNPSPGDIFFLY